MTRYETLIARRRREHGERFDASDLAESFVRYFNTGERVRVRMSYGEKMTGTIGVTGGWRPIFLLMRRSSDIGSCWTLSDRDQVVAVKRRREYVPVREMAR